MVVSCFLYHDQSLLDSEDQKQICLCWTIQVPRYSFQVSLLLNNPIANFSSLSSFHYDLTFYVFFQTLNRYISPEQVPVQYGGLSVDFCDCNPDFTMSDPVTEIPIKPTTKQTVEIAIYEVCLHLQLFFQLHYTRLPHAHQN